ncbi:MAG: glycosyltransferase family 4 protein [Candidatus Sumerlaeia bacterium]|nr:glycosyltransferase family 4 protein [Candidatus Sumerlaeia bacterium]
MNRVAFALAHLEPGGAERMAVHLARALPAHGWQVVFLLGEARGALLDEARALECPIVEVRARHWLPKTDPAFWLNACAVMGRMVSAARAHQCRVVQAWSFWDEALAVPAGWLTPGVRATISCRQNPGDELTRPHYRVIRAAANVLADAVVCTSPGVRRAVLARESFLPRRVVTIPNAVNVERFAGAAPFERSTLMPDAPPGAVLLGMLAHFKPQKRHDLFLEAFARARDIAPHLRAVLAGADLGTERATRRAATRLGLDDVVHFTGPVAATERLLAAVDGVVLPSDFEGMPLAVLEAMAAARPVIGTRVPGTEDAIVDGRTGLLVPKGDAAALAAAMIALASDPALRRRMGRAGQARVVRHFAVPRIAARYADLYARVSGFPRIAAPG